MSDLVYDKSATWAFVFFSLGFFRRLAPSFISRARLNQLARPSVSNFTGFHRIVAKHRETSHSCLQRRVISQLEWSLTSTPPSGSATSFVTKETSRTDKREDDRDLCNDFSRSRVNQRIFSRMCYRCWLPYRCRWARWWSVTRARTPRRAWSRCGTMRRLRLK